MKSTWHVVSARLTVKSSALGATLCGCSIGLSHLDLMRHVAMRSIVLIRVTAHHK